MDNTRVNTSELKPYLDAGWQLIPLHSHDYFDEHKGKKRERGKSPLHRNWTRKPYKSRDQVRHMRGGSNVGVRLRAGDLVIDVDPRNFTALPDGSTDDPLRRLCEDCEMDLSGYPTVETGSGGLHVYMKKPADVSVRDSLKDYEGVEFKTLGRQVVSAGSLHPSAKRTYLWDFLSPPLGEVGPAPTRLINLVAIFGPLPEEGHVKLVPYLCLVGPLDTVHGDVHPADECDISLQSGEPQGVGYLIYYGLGGSLGHLKFSCFIESL